MNLRTRRLIFWSGIGFAIGGLFLCEWSLRVHDRLFNYQRLATMLPLAYALPMLSIDTFASWNKSTSMQKLRAIGGIVVSVILTVGCLFWLIAAPGAR
jgi:Ca2+/Na+ antiporter